MTDDAERTVYMLQTGVDTPPITLEEAGIDLPTEVVCALPESVQLAMGGLAYRCVQLKEKADRLMDINSAERTRRLDAERQAYEAAIALEIAQAKIGELTEDSLIDQKTSLPNETAFLAELDTIDTELETVKGLGMDRRAGVGATTEFREYAVGILDLDGFKGVNDSLGHNAGDIVLIRVAGGLGRLFRAREREMCARIGGDEFGVLLKKGMDNPNNVAAVEQRILDAVRAEVMRVVASDEIVDSIITQSIPEVQKLPPEAARARVREAISPLSISGAILSFANYPAFTAHDIKTFADGDMYTRKKAAKAAKAAEHD